LQVEQSKLDRALAELAALQLERDGLATALQEQDIKLASVTAERDALYAACEAWAACKECVVCPVCGPLIITAICLPYEADEKGDAQ
jgi:hypothetical protein